MNPRKKISLQKQDLASIVQVFKLNKDFWQRNTGFHVFSLASLVNSHMFISVACCLSSKTIKYIGNGMGYKDIKSIKILL